MILEGDRKKHEIFSKDRVSSGPVMAMLDAQYQDHAAQVERLRSGYQALVAASAAIVALMGPALLAADPGSLAPPEALVLVGTLLLVVFLGLVVLDVVVREITAARITEVQRLRIGGTDRRQACVTARQAYLRLWWAARRSVPDLRRLVRITAIIIVVELSLVAVALLTRILVEI